MAPRKPRIIRFYSEEWGLGIDWDITRDAFILERQFGGAKLFGIPAYFQVGIDLREIVGFRLDLGNEADLAEVILDVTYHSGHESLGVTDQLEQAERWVQEANRIVADARATYSSQD